MGSFALRAPEILVFSIPRSHCRLEKHHRFFKGNLSTVRLFDPMPLLPTCSFSSSSLSCITGPTIHPGPKPKTWPETFWIPSCLIPDANQFRSILMIQILKMLANSALPLCFHPLCLSLGSQPLLPGTTSFSHVPAPRLPPTSPPVCPPSSLQNDLRKEQI